MDGWTDGWIDRWMEEQEIDNLLFGGGGEKTNEKQQSLTDSDYCAPTTEFPAFGFFSSLHRVRHCFLCFLWDGI